MSALGFSTLVEPCATAICASSAESRLAGASPGDFGFAVGTPVSFGPLGVDAEPDAREHDESGTADVSHVPSRFDQPAGCRLHSRRDATGGFGAGVFPACASSVSDWSGPAGPGPFGTKRPS